MIWRIRASDPEDSQPFLLAREDNASNAESIMQGRPIDSKGLLSWFIYLAQDVIQVSYGSMVAKRAVSLVNQVPLGI
jgi:hypothetical protein